MIKRTGFETTGIGTDETMAETKAGQPVVVTEIQPAKMTLAEVRSKLDGKTGRRFWKNLDELADTPAFHELDARVESSLPRQSGSRNEWVDSVSAGAAF